MLSSLAKALPFLVFCLAALIIGCAASTAPPGWLDKVEEVPQSGYGGWIRFSMESESTIVIVGEGELLAVSDDSLFWFDEYTVLGVARDRIKKLQLERYESVAGKLTTWTVLGILSTGSHGVVAVTTAPIWLITGIASTAAASWDPIEKLSEDEIMVPGDAFWKNIRKGARFPAGFPEGLDRSSLQPKPRGNIVRRVTHTDSRD